MVRTLDWNFPRNRIFFVREVLRLKDKSQTELHEPFYVKLQAFAADCDSGKIIGEAN